LGDLAALLGIQRAAQPAEDVDDAADGLALGGRLALLHESARAREMRERAVIKHGDQLLRIRRRHAAFHADAMIGIQCALSIKHCSDSRCYPLLAVSAATGLA